MALVVFLRGVNVGGNRTFRPSVLAKELREHDVVNIGAAGTFVVRKPGPRAVFLTKLRRKLPFETEVMICDGRDIIQLETKNPFSAEASRPEVVRFVSVLSKAGRRSRFVPVSLPADGKWLVRVVGVNKEFVFGMYRRHMHTIRYLGQLDKMFAAQATTRNWNTVLAIVRVLKGQEKKGRK